MTTAAPRKDAKNSLLQRAFPAILAGYGVLIVVCGLIIDGTRGRTALQHGAQQHIYLGFLAAVVFVFILAYALVLRSVLRTAWSWKSRALLSVMYLFLTLRWTLFACVLPISIVEAMLYYMPRTPVTFQTMVMESDRYRSRGSIRQAATFTGPGGERVRLTQSEWKPLRLFTAPMLVNGVCPLGELPPGLRITVQARSSSLGLAVDRITSAEPCQRKER